MLSRTENIKDLTGGFNIVKPSMVKTMAQAKQITKDMSIADVVMKWPETAGTFMEWGLHCYGCAVAKFENVEQGASAHGIDADKLIEALNEVLDKKE